MSSLKKHYTKKEGKLFAEKHGDFIISMMTEFKGHSMHGPAKENNKGKFEFKDLPDWTGGLYIFCLVDKEEDDDILPIFVGQTSQALRDRFRDKKLQKSVFKWFDQRSFHLYVVVCNLSYLQALLMKEVFLEVFDFIRYSAGSERKRKHLDYDKVYLKEESWDMVKGKWRYIKFDLKYVFATVEYMRP